MKHKTPDPAKIQLQIQQLEQQYEYALSGGKEFHDLKHIKDELKHLEKQLKALGDGKHDSTS